MKLITLTKVILTTLTGLLISIGSFAQKDEISVVRLENKSHRAYLEKNYEKALDCLFQLDTLVSYNSHLYDYWIGVNLLSTDKKLAAIPYLEHAQRSNQTSYVVNYYLGRAYMFAGRYEEAKKYLATYELLLKASGKIFKAEAVESEEHKIHVEKTLRDIKSFISECELHINNQILTIAD